MKYAAPPLVLLALLTGCFSAERKEVEKPAAVAATANDEVPAAQTPAEALRQLLEGNARSVHREYRWRSSAALQRVLQPFVVVVNASSATVVPEEAFDLPRGTVPVLNWKENPAGRGRLEGSLPPGAKLVVVLLPYPPAAWQKSPLAVALPDATAAQVLQAIGGQLRSESPGLARALALGQAKLCGGMLHPATGRLFCFPFTD